MLSLDAVLGGGLRCGSVTELVGCSSSGKTQLCLQSATAAAACCASVLYVDSGQAVSVERLEQMHRGLAQSGSAGALLPLLPSLQNLSVVALHDAHGLLALLHSVSASLQRAEQQPQSAGAAGLRLLIVDSVASLLSPVLGGRGAQHRGHALLSSIAHALHAVAQQQRLAVLLTNNTTANVGRREAEEATAAVHAALGESWRCVADTRLELTVDRAEAEAEAAQSSGSSRAATRCLTARLCKSATAPVGAHCRLTVDGKGVAELSSAG